jgi:hypothetical protein
MTTSEVVTATNTSAGRPVDPTLDPKTQMRGERKGYEGTKDRPRSRNPRRTVTDGDRATLKGTPPEVFETAPFDASRTLRVNGRRLQVQEDEPMPRVGVTLHRTP